MVDADASVLGPFSTAATAAIHPSVDRDLEAETTRGRGKRVRSGREKGGGARPIVSVGARRTWSLVKLLMRASGVFLLMNLAKSGCMLHRARSSPKRDPLANACDVGGGDETEGKVW